MNLRALRKKRQGEEDIPGLAYETADGSTLLRYLQEPDLEIPLIVVDGDLAPALADRLRADIAHVPETAAGLSYDAGASESVKLTLLKILAAHALADVTPAMTRVVALAASDPSPFIRLGAVQLFQYAQTPDIARIVRRALADDPDPDVRGYALDVLAHYDDATRDG